MIIDILALYHKHKYNHTIHFTFFYPPSMMDLIRNFHVTNN